MTNRTNPTTTFFLSYERGRPSSEGLIDCYEVIEGPFATVEEAIEAETDVDGRRYTAADSYMVVDQDGGLWAERTPDGWDLGEPED